MKKVLLAVLAVVLVVAIAANPSHDTHKDAMKEALVSAANESLRSELKDFGLFGSLGAALAPLLVEKGAELFLDHSTEYHYYLLCSTTTLDVEGKPSRTLSFGAFGYVFTFSKDDVVEMIKDEL
ncbi:MAG: DUF4359 domain-containing protein [Bacteroidaceae bacterium]|nr:DUF4359 domain-containing protein [Bacteroidaceae bacterium]